MSQENTEDQGVEMERADAESVRIRPVMLAGSELAPFGHQCLVCNGERFTRRPGIAGAVEQIRCEPCNGFGYVPRGE